MNDVDVVVDVDHVDDSLAAMRQRRRQQQQQQQQQEQQHHHYHQQQQRHHQSANSAPPRQPQHQKQESAFSLQDILESLSFDQGRVGGAGMGGGGMMGDNNNGKGGRLRRGGGGRGAQENYDYNDAPSSTHGTTSAAAAGKGQQHQQQRYAASSPATTVHDEADDESDENQHHHHNSTPIPNRHDIRHKFQSASTRHNTTTSHDNTNNRHHQFHNSQHSQHFRSDSNVADDEDEDHDIHDDDDSDAGSISVVTSSSSSSASSSPSSTSDSNHDNSNRDHNNDDDSSTASSSSVKSYLDAGYSNEEDYLFDQYGGVGGTAEERSELAGALAHTLNVGPMADELFYEEVAMCFLRCRERHRMRMRREERRRDSLTGSARRGEKGKKRKDSKKKKLRRADKMNNGGDGVGGEEDDGGGVHDRMAGEAGAAAMKMRTSGGVGGGGGEGVTGGRFPRRSSICSREMFDDDDDDEDDAGEYDHHHRDAMLRERMSRMNVRDPRDNVGHGGVGEGGAAGVSTPRNPTDTKTTTGVESEYEPGELHDTEDDDGDDSLSRMSDNLRNTCNVESDYEDVARFRYRRRSTRSRKAGENENNDDEADVGVEDDLSAPSTPMSSADDKEEEDSFMNGQKFNDAKLFHSVPGGSEARQNAFKMGTTTASTHTNRVQAEMEHDDGDDIAYDNLTRDSEDDEFSGVGHVNHLGLHTNDPISQQQNQQQHKPEPLFRVDLKSGGPPAGSASRNMKKGFKKGGGGVNRFPPPPPPRPNVAGGTMGGNTVDPLQQQQHAQQQQEQQAQTPSPMDVDEEQKPWEEKMARAARAAAEASALKNDHESLRREFSMGVSVSGPTKVNDGRKGVTVGGGGGGVAGRKHRSGLSSGSGNMGQPGIDADLPSSRHDATRMSLHDDVKQMSGDEDDEDSLRRQHVAHLRDEGRTFYINGAYRDSVLCYTEAISLRTSDFHDSTNDAILAALYGNRAAALMMTGAYEGAAADCERALLCTDANSVDSFESLESGPAFRSKILCRMARALLKAGNIWDADKAFSNSIQSAREALAMVGHQSQSAAFAGGADGAEETRGMEKTLNQSITDATLGLSDVKKYRDAIECANATETSKGVSPAADRRNNVQLLMSLNSALSVSPGSIELHERKVNALASLKRWAELGNHCERLAAESVKVEGLFTEDLASLNPFPDVRPAQSLKPDFFEKNQDDLLDPASVRILSPKAVCEGIIRMPNGILPTYLRSLRLEERYTEAAKAGASLEAHMSESKHRGSRGNVSITWLSTERDKLRRTMSWKEMGDTLFRSGDYERAGEKYAQCLTIDNDMTYNLTSLVNENAGGRLHAVLHCNRAACLMALKKYREAVKECTAALRIHTHYMKAMLRRGRCFARIRQYEEAIAEYERYIQLVIEARKSPQHASNSNAACTFDRPMDITEAEYNKAKQELVEVKKSMRNAAAQDQAQEKKQREQQFIFNKNFKAAANDAARRRQEAPTAKESAYTRKKQWDAGVNQRPWDTFDGSSPKKMNAKKEPPMSFHPSGGPNAARKHPKATMNRPYQQPQQKQQQQQHHYQQQQHQQQHRQQQQQQPPPPISKPTDNGDHYQVLGLLPTATATEIKKAYHKMALKYHPDKNSEEDAADIFRRVKLAYEVLGNEQSRVAYDSLRRVGRR